MKQCRSIVAILLLLAYTGQTVMAAGAPCFMMSSTSADMSHDMGGMDHSGHDMSSADQGSGCCDGGFCSMSNCQMSLAMPVTLAVGPAGKASTPVEAHYISTLTPPPESLYRPPISA